MAAVAATVVVRHSRLRGPNSDKHQVTVRTSALGAASDVEWIAAATLGLSYIHAVVGHAVIGVTTPAGGILFQKNAQGTSVAEGTNSGDLGIEAEDNIDVVEVTLIGTKA
jgi:hypothetical protein